MTKFQWDEFKGTEHQKAERQRIAAKDQVIEAISFHVWIFIVLLVIASFAVFLASLFPDSLNFYVSKLCQRCP